MNPLALGAFAGAGLCYALAVRQLNQLYPEPRWDWSTLDTDQFSFPPDFIWGTATAAHQVEGGNDNNNWSRWETQVDDKGRPRILDGQRCGSAVEHWERFRGDIERMKALGVNSYRFSLEWSRIEPSPGTIDEAAIAHYHEVIDALLEAGIEPMVTLHHFTHPLWFEDLQGFEREVNIDYFEAFCVRVFTEYASKVKWWCTHNEPGVFTSMGWWLSVFPPGGTSLARMGRVLCNLMKSHTRVYHRLKRLLGGKEAQIGLVKNVFQMDPYQRWSLLHWIPTRVLDGIYNESILGVLRQGEFRFWVPGMVNIRERIPGGAGSSDFVGLNYYSNILVSPFMKLEHPFEPLSRTGQVLTDMPYAMYPEGFYRALMRLNGLGLPIIVTENGIADHRDDRRSTWIRQYLYAMWRAKQDGCNVIGYHYWSLMDNFEWAEGYHMKFGLYEVNRETQERRLREGSRAYAEIIARGRSGSGDD